MIALCEGLQCVFPGHAATLDGVEVAPCNIFALRRCSKGCTRNVVKVSAAVWTPADGAKAENMLKPCSQYPSKRRIHQRAARTDIFKVRNKSSPYKQSMKSSPKPTVLVTAVAAGPTQFLLSAGHSR